MKLLRQLIQENEEVIDPDITVSFNWETENPSKNKIADEFKAFTNDGITIEDIFIQSGTHFESTLIGTRSVMLKHLVELFKDVHEDDKSGLVLEIVYSHLFIDVQDAVESLSPLGNDIAIYFQWCQLFAHLTKLVGDGYTTQCHKCVFGSAKDADEAGIITTEYVSGRIDEFDFQDQMIQAGLEKYL